MSNVSWALVESETDPCCCGGGCPGEDKTFSFTFSGITACPCVAEGGVTAALNFTTAGPLVWVGFGWQIDIDSGVTVTFYPDGCEEEGEASDRGASVILGCELVDDAPLYTLTIEFTTFAGGSVAFYSESNNLNFTNFITICNTPSLVLFTGGTAAGAMS